MNYPAAEQRGICLAVRQVEKEKYLSPQGSGGLNPSSAFGILNFLDRAQVSNLKHKYAK